MTTTVVANDKTLKRPIATAQLKPQRLAFSQMSASCHIPGLQDSAPAVLRRTTQSDKRMAGIPMQDAYTKNTVQSVAATICPENPLSNLPKKFIIEENKAYCVAV